MALTDLSSAQLERLVQLIQEKETLQLKLDRVNRSLERLDGHPVETQTKPSLRRGSRRRGLKTALLRVLQQTGKNGITVKDLAAKLKAKPARVSVWFYTTGKKIKEIKKVGTAKFAYLP